MIRRKSAEFCEKEFGLEDKIKKADHDALAEEMVLDLRTEDAEYLRKFREHARQFLLDQDYEIE